jgi:DNA replication initiation complex subunit (GINS family)
MNRSTTLRAEEARRQAQAASLEAKQRQAQMLEERASFFASETRKVFDLRAQRLAKMASSGIAGEPDANVSSVRPAVKRRRARA